jgi:MurNAc alpha-1-phosphate uridylyltransferase
VTQDDESEQLGGTAGALRLAYDLGLLEGAFGVLCGDSYLTVPFAAVWDRFDETGAPGIMTVYENDNRYDRSNAQLEGGFVVR